MIKYLPLVLFLALAIVCLSWFRGVPPDSFFYIHDQAPELVKSGSVSQAFMWSTNWLGTDGGMEVIRLSQIVPLRLLYSIGLGLKQAEIIGFLILFVMPAATMYFFLKRALPRGKKNISETTIAATLGALLYSFNLYLVIAWHSGMIFGMGIVYALLPLFLYFLWKNAFGEKKQPVRDGILAGLLFAIAGPPCS
jgi:hypothetical protein